MKICIYTFGFRRDCGGATALFKLAAMLRERGVDCRVLQDRPGDDHYAIPLADAQWVDPETWVVYPEIVLGNPVGANRVVRWLLNGVGVIGGDKTTWSPSDLVVAYLPRFRSDPAEELLTIFETWPGVNHHRLEAPRSGTCYAVHKGHRKPRIPETDGAEPVSRIPAEAAEVFRRSCRFISYDSATWLSVQAALCGCLSIVVPDDGVTANEWRAANPFTEWGIAYGFSPEEIKHAITTMDYVPEHLRRLKNLSEQQLSRFLERLQ